VDDYSALARGRPFTAHEWLSGVLFHLVQRLFGERGFDALILFKAGIAVAVAWILYRAAAAQGAAPLVAIPCLAWVMILAAARFLERPHIFGYLLTALFLWILARRSAAGARGLSGPILLLLPLQVLWANLHGSFLMGPVIVLLAAAGEGIDAILAHRGGHQAAGVHWREASLLGLLAALLVAACLVNPYGWRLLLFPFELTGSGFMDLIYEWLPPYDKAFRTTYMMRYYVVWAACGALVLGAVLLRARRRGTGWPASFPFLLFAATFALSLRMNRNVTDFALATCPAVGAAATRLLAQRGALQGPSRRAALPAITLALLALAAWFAAVGYPFSPSTRREFGLGLGAKVPVAAADYMARNGIRGASFNTYGAGAYLVYRFYPAVRVAMDSRNDVYGEDLYAEYRKALVTPAAMRALVRRVDASFIFLEWSQQGMSVIARTIRETADNWRQVYFDDAAVVYVREEGPYADLARRDGYQLLDPSLFAPGDWKPEEATAALQEAERALARSGGAYIARVMRIDALLSLGRGEEAAFEEARIVDEDPPLAHIDILLGLAHLRRGDRATAQERFRRALELNPYSQAASEGLRLATEGR
jgi:tetratricopeptide (TPR) repeat protein